MQCLHPECGLFVIFLEKSGVARRATGCVGWLPALFNPSALILSLSLMWIGNGDKVVSVTVRIAVTQLVAGGK